MPEKHPVRAIHLFSDRKFLGWVRQTFSTTNWTSYYVILDSATKKSCINIDEHTIEVSSDGHGQQIVLEKFVNMDIAFHYFLDNVIAGASMGQKFISKQISSGGICMGLKRENSYGYYQK